MYKYSDLMTFINYTKNVTELLTDKNNSKTNFYNWVPFRYNSSVRLLNNLLFSSVTVPLFASVTRPPSAGSCRAPANNFLF
jgi:hypothetical protein